MKICEFVSSLCSGGAENFVRILSRCLKRSGHDVTILLLKEINQNSPYELNAVKEMEDAGIKVISLGLNNKFGHSIRIFFSAMRFFLCHDFDVVHTHDGREDILSVFCRFLFCKHYKCVSTLHSSFLPHSGLQGKLVLFLHKHSIHSVFCGKEAYEANQADFPKSTYIANGVDINPGLCSPVTVKEMNTFHTVLLAVGRLVEAKNQAVMLEAMKYVAEKHPDCGLLICGKGDLENDLRTKVHELNLEKNVILLGERKDVPALLQKADYFVSTSIYEGLPIAVLEACARKVPALLSPIPPHLALTEKIHGCFCAEKETPESFADLVNSCIEQNAAGRITEDMWKQDMKEYSIEKCCEKYLEVFRQ